MVACRSLPGEVVELEAEVSVEKSEVTLAAAPKHVVFCAQVLADLKALLHLNVHKNYGEIQ